MAVYTCPHCAKKYALWLWLQRHIKNVHKKDRSGEK